MRGRNFSAIGFGFALAAGVLPVACGTSSPPHNDSSAGAGSGAGPVAGNGGAPAQGGDASGGSAVGGTAGGASSCAAGTVACGDRCVSTLTDAANCGGCGTSCASGQACVNGACQCASGYLDCGGTCLESNAQNCGACGNACAAGLVCSGGTCRAGCASGLTACGGACFDLTGHRLHCGSCDNACPEGQDCWQSQCGCPTGQRACSGSVCQDVLSDEANCGDCSNTCVSGATCTQGVCTCPEGQTPCAASNSCRDLMSDPQNCGACGNTCGGGTQCLFGGCVDPNSVNCGGGAHTDEKCTSGASNLRGKYYVSNNLWGASSGSGTQCIWNTCMNGDLVGWGTHWNWTGQTSSVKSFASIVFGWHWGWQVQNTGLPIPISSNTNVNCGWAFTVNLGGGTDVMNVAYDMWVHTVSNPGSNSTPTDEIMVWLYRNGGAGPVGSRTVQNVSIGGHTWDLYEGFTTLNVFSFIRTSNATTAVLNMMAFPRYLVSNGKMANSKYISSVQAGTEVFTGQAEVETNGFYCRIQ